MGLEISSVELFFFQKHHLKLTESVFDMKLKRHLRKILAHADNTVFHRTHNLKIINNHGLFLTIFQEYNKVLND